MSSQAAPSPARHLRTNSARSLAAKALAALTFSLRLPRLPVRLVPLGFPLVRRNYDSFTRKVPGQSAGTSVSLRLRRLTQCRVQALAWVVYQSNNLKIEL